MEKAEQRWWGGEAKLAEIRKTADHYRTCLGLMVECVNAHDRCEGSHPCTYCEPVAPLRRENGQFA